MRPALFVAFLAAIFISRSQCQSPNNAMLQNEKRLAQQFDWKQQPAEPRSLAAGENTARLSPCPRGFSNQIDNSNSNHWIYIDSASGDAQQPGEPVLITAENCPAGAASGTITFTAAYPHAAGYTLESGTGGIKEASIDANQIRSDNSHSSNAWIEVIPQLTTRIKAPLYWQTTMGRLIGPGLVECSVNMSCINIGDTNSGGFAKGNSIKYVGNIMDGFWMRPDPAMKFWDVAPSQPETITPELSLTLTIPKCPLGFWPRIPNQILWLNGTSGGLVTTPYEPGAPGPGEFVRVTGGSCTPGIANGTIEIVPATPGIRSFFPHGKGYTLSNGATAYIEDNSQGTVIENILTNGFVGDVGYGFVIQNDNDQGNEVLNVNMDGGLRCDNDFCGATLFGPGPNGFNAGITNMMFGTSAQCAEWYDGNDFYIGPTVCQGFNNFGLFLSTKRGGALQRATIHAVHRERGNLSNSVGKNLGAADMIVEGYNVEADGNGEATTTFPAFPVAGEPKGQLQLYYLSIVNQTDRTKTVPIPIGKALVDDPGAHPVTVRWASANALPGKIINFELYRLSPASQGAGLVPYPGICDGTSATCLVASNLDPAQLCDIHGACTFVDKVSKTTPGTPFTGSDGNKTGGYFPFIGFNPGGVVLSAGATYHGEPTCIVATAPWLREIASSFNNAVAPGNCLPSGGSFNNTLNSQSSDTISYPQPGILLPDRNRTNDAGRFTGLKGRINLIGGGSYPRDLFTWVDSNPAKTMASKGEYGDGQTGSVYGTFNRPQWDVGDIATGVENNGTGLYNRVPTKGVFDWYIGALPNSSPGQNSDWTEQISARQHSFNLPIKVGSAGTPITQMTLFDTGKIEPSEIVPNSCSDQPFPVKGLLGFDKISQVTPPGALSNVSVNAYAATAGNAIILHFCNPTSSPAKPPAGNYSFLAVH
ncbi:MAG TPA: hypothetical protein VFO39_10835 [Candidatus Sulfotelmatobacter sp.]|nr:hypothetical protein [Candidatus Sulfotelmatobacter sp.]